MVDIYLNINNRPTRKKEVQNKSDELTGTCLCNGAGRPPGRVKRKTSRSRTANQRRAFLSATLVDFSSLGSCRTRGEGGQKFYTSTAHIFLLAHRLTCYRRQLLESRHLSLRHVNVRKSYPDRKPWHFSTHFRNQKCAPWGLFLSYWALGSLWTHAGNPT